MMAKPLILCALVQLSLSLVSGGDSCSRISISDQETACKYPRHLILESLPGKRRLDAGNCDAEFEKQEWQQPPTVAFPEAEPNKTYAVLNVDPDPPGYEKGQYWLHWLVSGVEGEDFAKGDLSRGRQLASYYGPAPPSGSGLHRYMFLAFEERGGSIEGKSPERRSRFDLDSWLRENPNLCGPVAGAQFRTRF